MSAFDEWHTEEIENDLFNLEPIDIAERAFNAREDYIKNLKLELALMKAVRPSQQEIDNKNVRIKELEAQLAEAKRSEEIYESIVEGVEAVMSDIEPEIVHLPEAVKKLREALQDIIDMEVPGRILVLSDAVDIAKQALKE